MSLCYVTTVPPNRLKTPFPASVCYQDYHEYLALALLMSPGLSCPYMRLLGPSSRLEEASVIPLTWGFENKIRLTTVVAGFQGLLDLTFRADQGPSFPIGDFFFPLGRSTVKYCIVLVLVVLFIHVRCRRVIMGHKLVPTSQSVGQSVRWAASASCHP